MSLKVKQAMVEGVLPWMRCGMGGSQLGTIFTVTSKKDNRYGLKNPNISAVWYETDDETD